MKLKIYVQTWKVGSRCEDIIEIDPEELEDMSEKQQEEYFEEIANDTVFGGSLFEWGWSVIDD